MTEPLAELLGAEKRIRPLPSWRPVDDSGSIRWKAPLIVGGATLEGFSLHARCMAAEPGRDVSFILERVLAGQPSVRIDRIDWNPITPHNNKGIGPPELRYKLIHGTHRHAFEANLKEDGSLRTGNLPVAVPVSDHLPTFEALVDFVGSTYNIPDLKFLTAPPWTSDLFGAAE